MTIATTNLSGSNHKTAAAWNRGLAVRLLRKHECLSRSQISQMTGLRGSTLTYIVRELMKRNVVRTVGTANSKRVGKKQVLLKINPSLGWTLGVALRPGMARMVLLDASAERIASYQGAIGTSLETVPADLQRHLEDWMKQIERPAGRMLAMGVGVPGMVDVDRGVVLRSMLFGATDVPLRKMLADTFGVPTVIDHDACFAAGAEALTGAARGKSHFIYFSLNHKREDDVIRFNSYGSALYLEGKVYRGAHYCAGEFSATLLPPVLETDPAELEAMGTANGGMSPKLHELAQYLGQTLVGIINFVDVQMIVIGGTAGLKNRAFLDVMEQEIRRSLIPIPGREMQLIPTAIGSEAVSRGAALSASDMALVGAAELTDDPAAIPAGRIDEELSVTTYQPQ
jgi:predicted NBD/HSP70 family sugar kinase